MPCAARAQQTETKAGVTRLVLEDVLRHRLASEHLARLLLQLLRDTRIIRHVLGAQRKPAASGATQRTAMAAAPAPEAAW